MQSGSVTDMASTDASRYARLAAATTDPELRSYYRDKAAEVTKSAVSSEVEQLTKAYVNGLRLLGVDIPKRVSVEVKEG
jgi:hypothetical protein